MNCDRIETGFKVKLKFVLEFKYHFVLVLPN